MVLVLEALKNHMKQHSLSVMTAEWSVGKAGKGWF